MIKFRHHAASGFPGISMTFAQKLRKLGFRRWYERQLIEGHLYLVTCFLCMILVAACLEEFGDQGPGRQPALMLTLAVLGAGVGAVTWRRFKDILSNAEHMADRASCGTCGNYARFVVLGDGGQQEGEGVAGWVRVRCRNCSHEWLIE
jgi:hypothetical protein